MPARDDAPEEGVRQTTLRLAFETFSVVDMLMLGYLWLVAVLVALWGTGPHRAHSGIAIYINIAIVLLACYLARANPWLPLDVRRWIYRGGLSVVLLRNYLMLRELLPTIRPDNVDAALLRWDVRAFGTTPAVWMDRFNARTTVEWFAFFYFSYFFICAFYLMKVLFRKSADRAVHEFAIGTAIVFCIGELGYMAVPATGPGAYMPGAFQSAIDGGFFWHCVTRTVNAGSALKDVFPSLHTAVPTWFVWFAFERSKTDRRWKLARNVTMFFAANIVISTMFLRWHYAVDVAAGLLLSSFAGWASPRLAGAEGRFREREGLSIVWALPKSSS